MPGSGAPRVVAVVCSYWPKRRENVWQIIQDLRGCTRPPDAILVLDNYGSEPLSWDLPGAQLITCEKNTECRGKFVAALFDPADYYLLLDDDTSVGPKTIETLLGYSHREICTGYLGCWLTPDGGLNAGARLWPYDTEAVVPCDTFCGCGLWMSWKALHNYHGLDMAIRRSGLWPELEGDPPLAGDDIVAGLANPGSCVVPLPKPDAMFRDLGYQEQAMCYAHPDYYGMRDRFTKVVLKVKARGGW
jgi:hypothetical protein